MSIFFGIALYTYAYTHTQTDQVTDTHKYIIHTLIHIDSDTNAQCHKYIDIHVITFRHTHTDHNTHKLYAKAYFEKEG